MSCEGQISEEAQILRAMLYRAADMGADGVLVGGEGIGQSEPTTGNTEKFDIHIHHGLGLLSLGGDKYVFRGEAIRFKTP
jgi:hypothetical protein